MPDNEKKGAVTGQEPSRSMTEAGRYWDPFASLHTEMDQLFNALRGGLWPSLSGRTGSEPTRTGPSLSGQMLAPAVDIAEKNGQYELTAELPGLDPEQVEVKLSDGRLTIKGEKKEEKEEEKEGYYLSERRFGSFQRSFAVPEGIDADKIVAEFKNGVLKIMLPKTPEAQQKEKKISIQSR